MPVYRLAITLCSLDLSYHILVASQQTRIIHHLCQETDILARHQRFDILNANLLTAGLHIAAYCRHATGSTEAEVKAYLTSRACHIVDTLYAKHIANLMRVGNHTDGTMTDSNVRKLVGYHHTALDMNVTVDETWHDVRPGIITCRQIASLYLNNLSVIDDKLAIKDLASHYVDDVSFYVIHDYNLH